MGSQRWPATGGGFLGKGSAVTVGVTPRDGPQPRVLPLWLVRGRQGKDLPRADLADSFTALLPNGGFWIG